MEEKEYLEELKADKDQEVNRKRYVGMNGELISGIVVISISLIWLLFTWLVARRIYTMNWIILGAGVLILGLGLFKYYRIKNNDLDF